MGAKHKKTRKQKIIADLNRNIYTLKNKNISSLNPTINAITFNKGQYSYSYVFHDVMKTGILTFVIAALELILFFLLKNHMITIPKINY